MLNLKSALAGSVSVVALVSAAHAENFNIPSGDLVTALNAYSAQARVALIYPDDALKNAYTSGAKGSYSAADALSRLLKGTGFTTQRDQTGAVAIVPAGAKHTSVAQPVMHLAQAEPMRAASSVETVVVTSSKIKGDIQTVPIAITALSQEQLTSRQIAGGPDLVKEVPNLTFSKTNFTGYNLEIRGIGTQAISVTTDPAVAVAFNDTPFIRNHFFEQEFFDVSQVEVLRGPQGTLYGRNATAGVVNVVSAKPTDEFEAMLSADIGNYTNRRYEGMINLPIVGDKLALRIAGEWTKRDGYTFNETTGKQTDGRDLWSSRVTLGWKPTSSVEAYLVWEHFQESDDRLRSGKQLCKTDFGPGATSITSPGHVTAADGTVVTVAPAGGDVFGISTADLSQGCLPDSLYAKDSFQVPNGFSLPFISGASFEDLVSANRDPYANTVQSTNLRNIQSALEPKYLANNDTLEFNASWNVTPSLTFSSDTGYNRDFLWSTEDYNRFDTQPGIFIYNPGNNRGMNPTGNYVCSDGTYSIGSPSGCTGHGGATPTGYFCDPQLGCSDRLVVQDLAEEHAWQFSQEFRLASSFSGPFNFSVGGNYLHYETVENYYVFSNTFTMIALNNVGCNATYVPNVTNNLYCLSNGRSYDPHFPNVNSIPTESPQYIDPNPLSSLNNEGHNYFVSQNPYVLNSYAGFGEAYYDVTPELKLTAGLRWTDDEKHFSEIPSELLVAGYGYPALPPLNQAWHEWTGRFVANWTPKLDFTDQSMFYASYGRGYKAGGANPPGPVLLNADVGSANNISFPVHPFDFKPEFIDAYELGTKNTFLDGGLTLNGDIFFYNYKGYQISQIVDRSSINLNFDATVRGAELEATYEPLAGLKFSFAGGYEDTNINNNQYAIDLIDRTAGVPGWIVVKPSVGQSSNCIVPEYVAAALIQAFGSGGGQGSASGYICGSAYTGHVDPVTGQDYVTETGNGTHAPTTCPPYVGGFQCAPPGYPGYDPNTVDPNLNPALISSVNNGLGLPPNNGEGFAKNVGGKELPNAPHFTTSLTADYTMPVSANWAATLHGDFYWQSQSFARVFNDRPYDKIRGYSNVNMALILTDASGWQVMGYVKNIFDTTAITGDFLNSDDSGLTTNIFLTDPRLYGVRITKQFTGGSDNASGFDIFSNADGERPTFWLTVGGNYNFKLDAKTDPYNPLAASHFPNGGSTTPPWASGLPTPAQLQKNPTSGFDWEGALSYQPEDSNWVLKAGIRYGRSAHDKSLHKSQFAATRTKWAIFPHFTLPCTFFDHYYPTFSDRCRHGGFKEFVDSHNHSSERHAILDFEIGRNVGIGSFNGTISAGVRVAQFNSQNVLILGADPHYDLSAKYHEVYEFKSQEERSSHGIGPELSWDASSPLWGDTDNGRLALDWGVNLAVLFARQSVNVHHDVKHCFVHGGGSLAACDGGGISGSGDAMLVEPPDNVSRSTNVTVPNLGAHLGLSINYQNAKISFGYRADEFFKAIDAGEYSVNRANRGFNGPYLNLSVGFGG